MTILLATHRRATEIDRLIDELRRREAAFLRVNMGVGEDRCVARSPFGSSKDVVFDTDQGLVGGDEIRTGWYHQPAIGIVPETVARSRSGREAVLTSHTNTWHGAFSLLACDWLNSPDGVQQGANKILQGAAASRAGFSLPRTIVGNIPSRIRAALAGTNTVAKNIATLHQAWGERADLSFLTRAIALDDVSDEAISACPVIYQATLRPWREHRVVIVAERAFMASIDLDARNGHIDVRTSPTALSKFYASQADTEVVTKLQTMLADFKLHYCSADILEDDEGRFFFLDLNTCGAWWWIDDLYTGAITGALADALTSELT